MDIELSILNGSDPFRHTRFPRAFIRDGRDEWDSTADRSSLDNLLVNGVDDSEENEGDEGGEGDEGSGGEEVDTEAAHSSVNLKLLQACDQGINEMEEAASTRTRTSKRSLRQNEKSAIVVSKAPRMAVDKNSIGSQHVEDPRAG